MDYWENKIYSKGRHLNKYPFDAVVSFVFRYYNRKTNKSDQRILELGCGAGNNLSFAQKEGFKVVGVDISESAIEYCKSRFRQEGLYGEFFQGDFSKINLAPNSIDLVIDRASICCCPIESQKKVIEKVFYALKPNGVFLFTPYSQNHESYDEVLSLSGGFMTEINKGDLKGIEGINFNNKIDLDSIIAANKWSVLEYKEIISYEKIDKESNNSAQWHIVLRKMI